MPEMPHVDLAVRQRLSEHLVVLMAHSRASKLQLFETRQPSQWRQVTSVRVFKVQLFETRQTSQQ